MIAGLEEVGGGVDVIVSEWMGYLLIYESMLRSVIVARDRFLKPDGHMFPSHAKLYLAPYSDKDYFDSYVNYWDDVYGVNMCALGPSGLPPPLPAASAAAPVPAAPAAALLPLGSGHFFLCASVPCPPRSTRSKPHARC